MRKSPKERRGEELKRLKEILSRLPKENIEYKVDILANINPVLKELSQKGYIGVRLYPGYNDPEQTENPDLNQIKKYGVQIYIEPSRATKWDWELIKKALIKIGFCYSGQGQADWYLNLEP